MSDFVAAEHPEHPEGVECSWCGSLHWPQSLDDKWWTATLAAGRELAESLYPGGNAEALGWLEGA